MMCDSRCWKDVELCINCDFVESKVKLAALQNYSVSFEKMAM